MRIMIRWWEGVEQTHHSKSVYIIMDFVETGKKKWKCIYFFLQTAKIKLISRNPIPITFICGLRKGEWRTQFHAKTTPTGPKYKHCRDKTWHEQISTLTVTLSFRRRKHLGIALMLHIIRNQCGFTTLSEQIYNLQKVCPRDLIRICL